MEASEGGKGEKKKSTHRRTLPKWKKTGCGSRNLNGGTKKKRVIDVDPGTANYITPPPQKENNPTVKELTSHVGQQGRQIAQLEQQVTAKDEEIASLHKKMSKLKEELNLSYHGKWAEKKATNNLLAAADDQARVAMDKAAKQVQSAERLSILAEEGATRTIRAERSYQEAKSKAKRNYSAQKHRQKDAQLMEALNEAALQTQKHRQKDAQLKVALKKVAHTKHVEMRVNDKMGHVNGKMGQIHKEMHSLKMATAVDQVETAWRHEEERKRLMVGQHKATHAEKRLAALKNAESRIRVLQDKLADESGVRKEQSVAIAGHHTAITELEDTILELQGDVDAMTPRIVGKVARKAGGVAWPNWALAMFVEMLACRTPPSCVAPLILIISSYILPGE